ncbi:MAG: reverse transcriptase/maturase family protein [Lachnospiraceae bacterium]|nr:reverse transcriptase/maturase family protein [Lachnospiraceae bacterium]
MKRVGYLYEKMLNLDIIKLAIHKAAQGKTTRGYIAVVLNDIDNYARQILTMLETDSVTLSPNRQITLYDRSCEKTRIITVPKFYPDQIIHWVVMLVLEPVIKRGMYRYSCGSVPNRGGMEAKRYVERIIKQDKARYVAKLDISKFFNNVKPAILMSLFRRKIKDERFLRLIEKILENGGNCLPIGYYTSQWFSNFYLERFDHFVKEQLKVDDYVRFVDDMLLSGTNKRKLRRNVAAMDEYLKTNLGVELKGNYQIWKIHSRPIDFVGFRFYRHKTLLRKKIYYRLCRRLRNVKKAGYITVKQAQGLLSLTGWLTHINGLKFYKERIYPIAPKWKLKRIVSNHSKKLLNGGNYDGKGIQQKKVAGNG